MTGKTKNTYFFVRFPELDNDSEPMFNSVVGDDEAVHYFGVEEEGTLGDGETEYFLRECSDTSGLYVSETLGLTHGMQLAAVSRAYERAHAGLVLKARAVDDRLPWERVLESAEFRSLNPEADALFHDPGNFHAVVGHAVAILDARFEKVWEKVLFDNLMSENGGNHEDGSSFFPKAA